MTKPVKTVAREAFITKDYKEAFSILLEIGVSEFVSYGQKVIPVNKKRNLTRKENWFLAKSCSQELWGDFLLNNDVFQKIFSSDEALSFLEYYFKSNIYLYPELGKKLAKEFPELFVRSVRVYQLFLEPEGMFLLANAIEIPEVFQLHQKTWHILGENEQVLWAKVEDALQKVRSLAVPEILSYLIVWLENERVTRNSTQDMHHFAGVYSFFIQIVLKEVSQPIPEFDDVFLTEVFLEKFRDKSRNDVCDLLRNIDLWYQYYTSIVSPYSFDLNFQPIIENGSVYLYEPPLANYNYKLSEVRYNYNNLRYYGMATVYIAELEMQNKVNIPNGAHSNVKDENRELAIQQTQTRFILNDLGITHLFLQGKQIPFDKVIDSIRTYASNRKSRYEKPLRVELQGNKVWSDAYIRVIQEAMRNGITNLPSPYIYLSIEHYHDLNKQASEEMTLQDTEEIIDLFSYSVNPKNKFNRFNNNYDVLLKPFIKLNNYIFSPQAFFANNDWTYAAAQAGLVKNRFKSKADVKAETEQTEKSLGYSLTECNKLWKVIVTDQHLANEIKGDVDIIIEDDTHTLFMQLKRPYFRLEPKSAYLESLNDIKAAEQLNNAQESLSVAQSPIKIVHKPIKWIVSSSYEGIGMEISNCRKINYFDLLSAVRSHKFETVIELIDYMELDKELKDFRKGGFSNSNVPHKQMVDALFNPLKYRQPQDSKIPISIDNTQLSRETRTIFSKGLELNKQGKNNAAIKVFQNYIERVPSNFEAHGAIANVYADIKDFNSAFKYFNIAMELSEFEPEIVKNYVLACAESGNLEHSFQLFKFLLESYPFMDFHDVANTIRISIDKIRPQQIISLN